MIKGSMKIGLFGIGLDTYWPQFEGLKERPEGYTLQVQHYPWLFILWTMLAFSSCQQKAYQLQKALNYYNF